MNRTLWGSFENPTFHAGQVELMAPRDAVIDTRDFASAEMLGAHLNSLVRRLAAHSVQPVVRIGRGTRWRDTVFTPIQLQKLTSSYGFN